MCSPCLVALFLVSGLAAGGLAAHAADPGAATSGVLTRPPEVLRFVAASPPASEEGQTATVVLLVTIRADGTVEEASISASAGAAFDAAALEAVRQFLFSPAEIDGVPARIRILYQYDFVEQIEEATTGGFSGVVRNRETKAPLAGVSLALSDGQVVITDAEGRFSFADLPPGAVEVTLSGERLTPLSTAETIIAGERLEAIYDVFLNEIGEEGDDLEILVSAPALRRQVVSVQVSAEEARKIPGTQGDVLRVVENLPGVARSSLGSGALVVWGAAPGDTGVYVDGVPVPRLYHDGGLRSIMGSDFVQSVELLPGGYGAAYGRNIGGLVSVTTNRFDEEPQGAIAADLYDVSAAFTGPVSDRLSYGVGGRYGYVGTLLSTFSPDVEDFFPIPNYYDAQGRLGVRLGPGQTLDLTGLISSDFTESTAPSADPSREASEQERLDFQRVSLRYTSDRGDGSTVTAVLFGGLDQVGQRARFGSVATALQTEAGLVGARASYRARPADFMTIEAGFDSLIQRAETAWTGSVALPPREGDIRVFGQPPPDQISADTFWTTTLNAAPYVESDVGVGSDRLHWVTGLRFDTYARSVSRSAPQEGISPTHGLFAKDGRWEPRVSLRYAPSTRTQLTAAYGRYGQQPQFSDLSASFGNPSLPAVSAQHLLLGGTLQDEEEALSLEVTAFYTWSEGLAVRNEADQPARAEALTAEGEGRTYGGQAMLRLASQEDVSGWLSYTLAWSERRSAEDLDWRPSDYDQRHVLTALGTYAMGHGIDLGVRGRLATGFPRTEVTGVYYDIRRDLYQPLFGEHNQLRIPTFFQADIRASKKFLLRNSELEASLEIQNATNRANTEEFTYSPDYSRRGAIRGLPILPVIGLRWSY